ncbi:MAG TPA: hypothetical protein PK867_08000 [Pirellulales bacterium]|nr:hypothetical protein [Pirellulales bacterium]
MSTAIANGQPPAAAGQKGRSAVRPSRRNCRVYERAVLDGHTYEAIAAANRDHRGPRRGLERRSSSSRPGPENARPVRPASPGGASSGWPKSTNSCSGIRLSGSRAGAVFVYNNVGSTSETQLM